MGNTQHRTGPIFRGKSCRLHGLVQNLFLALGGMSALLASGHIKLLIIEMSPANDASLARIVSALADYGYEARTIEREGSLGDAFTEHDASALQHTVTVAFKSRPPSAVSG